MSDLVKRLRSANTSLNEGDCCGQLDASGTCMAPACIFGEALKMAHEAAYRIKQLEAALRAIDEQFADAAQDDCENGVRWLNARAAEKYLYEYPHTSAAISFAKKVARAALGEEHT